MFHARLVAVHLTVYIATNIKSKYIRWFKVYFSNDEILFQLPKFPEFFIDPKSSNKREHCSQR